jgi:hypothetical protein
MLLSAFFLVVVVVVVVVVVLISVICSSPCRVSCMNCVPVCFPFGAVWVSCFCLTCGLSILLWFSRVARDAQAGATPAAPAKGLTPATSTTSLTSTRKPYWKESKDPNTGRTYYYHTGTRETRWTKPDDMEDGTGSKAVAADSAGQQGMFGRSAAERADDLESQVDAGDEAHAFDQDGEGKDEELISVGYVNSRNKPMLSDSVKNQIALFKLENYAKTYFKLHSKGFFGSCSLDEMLSWCEVHVCCVRGCGWVSN